MGHIRSPHADLDLDDIWYYVATKSGSLETADRVIDAISARLVLLGQHPQLGRVRDEYLRSGLRSFPVGEYVIFYRIQDADAVVLRVVRGSRDLTAIFND